MMMGLYKLSKKYDALASSAEVAWARSVGKWNEVSGKVRTSRVGMQAPRGERGVEGATQAAGAAGGRGSRICGEGVGSVHNSPRLVERWLQFVRRMCGWEREKRNSPSGSPGWEWGGVLLAGPGSGA